jgi:hypothetical protein
MVRGISILFLIMTLTISSAFTVRPTEVSKAEFYKAFSGDSQELMDKVLAKLESGGNDARKQAYQGSLLMKKAAFAKGVKAKVNIFKKGAKLLEKQIDAAPANAEFRFLRLCVQEHAPAILGYNKDMEADKNVISEGFEKMDGELKAIVKDYAATSKEIKLSDLE